MVSALTKMLGILGCVLETWFWIWDSSPNEAIESCFSVTLNLSHKVCSNFQVYPLYFTSCLQVASLALVIMRPFRNYTPKINFECKFPNNFVWQNQFSDICYPIKNHVTTESCLVKINSVKLRWFKINWLAPTESRNPES